METTRQLYKIARVLDDGKRTVICWLDDLNKAKQVVNSLNELCPGDYSLEPGLQPGNESPR